MINPIAPITDAIAAIGSAKLNKEVRDILNTKLALASTDVATLTREKEELAAKCRVLEAENALLKTDKEQLQQQLRDALLPRGPVSPSISAPVRRKPRSLDGW